MSLANIINPIDLNKATIDISFARCEFFIPADVQARVDSNFESFAQKQEEKTGKRPTKGETGVLKRYQMLPNGVEGACGVSTFDRVLYFARTQIPQGDYYLGRLVGFPLASWAVPLSIDNKLVFARKKGAEGAYAGNPYSGFGSLVSIDKDIRNGSLDVKSFLERSVGGEVGSEVWKMVGSTRLTGLNDHDENSSKVNNGYDLVMEVGFDSPAQKIISNLVSNPQFTSKEAVYVTAEPKALGEFAQKNLMTHSGIIGLFSYIGSRFGIDEAVSQLKKYREAGKQMEITFHNFLGENK